MLRQRRVTPVRWPVDGDAALRQPLQDEVRSIPAHVAAQVEQERPVGRQLRRRRARKAAREVLIN